MTGSNASASVEFGIRLFAQLQHLGVKHVVASPGSRSTPLTLGAHAVGLDLEMQLDERSGGFYALGLAVAARTPVALVCTSGTAAANYLPAVIEAAHSGVPLLVFTADRPPELRGWGANQTIAQVGLYGSNVNWSYEAPVPSEAPPGVAAAIAARAFYEATQRPAGPVHVNFPFREPLIDPAGMPDVVASNRPIDVAPTAVGQPDPANIGAVVDLVKQYERGVIVAGPANHDAEAVAAVADLARVAHWPILAEPASQLRTGSHVADGLVISTADSLLRSEGLADRTGPDVVLTVGGAPTSKPVRLWLEQTQPGHVVVSDVARELPDPDHLATRVVRSPGASLASRVAGAAGAITRTSHWAARWRAADDAAADAITATLHGAPLTEPGAVRAVADALPGGAAVYLANSMPVRDADAVWPAVPTARRFYSHRGASGIDGLTSGAAGAAHGLRSPVVLVTGDLSFLHDLGGLMAAGREGSPLVVVVLDNGGGGIFSMLPVSEALPGDVFSRLFTTPHGVDPGALAEAAGVKCLRPRTTDELRDAVAGACFERAPTVIHLRLDPASGFEQRRNLAAAAVLAATPILAQ